MIKSLRHWFFCRELAVLMVFVLFFFLGDGALAGMEWQSARSGLLRLHILAASDSPADQQVKLQVRDALLAEYGQLFLQPATESDAEKLAARVLPDILSTARGVLLQNGDTRPVSAAISSVFFPSRPYGDVVLPAGTYRAVQIVLGEGVGANWWCVLYPPLCLSAAADHDAVFDVTTEPLKLEPRLAVVDAAERIMERLQNARSHVKAP